MKAQDIMTANPAAVTPNDSLGHAAEIMRSRGVGLVPVVDDLQRMHLEGVITDRDIAVRCVAHQHGTGCRVSDHMTSGQLDTVHPDDDVGEVIARMKRDQVRRIPVVDERGRLAGIIAQADLATKLGPKEPTQVEQVLERISAPATAPVA
jgi:CBS domain-containing protein